MFTVCYYESTKAKLAKKQQQQRKVVPTPKKNHFMIVCLWLFVFRVHWDRDVGFSIATLLTARNLMNAIDTMLTMMLFIFGSKVNNLAQASSRISPWNPLFNGNILDNRSNCLLIQSIPMLSSPLVRYQRTHHLCQMRRITWPLIHLETECNLLIC